MPKVLPADRVDIFTIPVRRELFVMWMVGRDIEYPCSLLRIHAPRYYRPSLFARLFQTPGELPAIRGHIRIMYIM